MEVAVQGIYAQGVITRFANLLKSVYNGDSPDATNVTELEAGSLVVSRQFLGLVLQALEERPPSSQIVENVLNIAHMRSISFEEQTTNLRLKLAAAFEKESHWILAANALSGINIESAQRQFPSEFKTELYLRMGKLYLEGSDIDNAEAAANRANQWLVECKSMDTDFAVQHKALWACILDRRRRFVDAAQRYFELSQTALLPECDQRHALSAAMKCTVLAAPGTSRTQLLAALQKDQRTQSIPSFTLLEKLFKERLIRVHEKDLESWQRENNGVSIIRSVMIEHNLTAAGQLYSCIGFKRLAELLGIDEKEAELTASKMIASERLKGVLDQVSQSLTFDTRNPIEIFDEQIGIFCKHLEKTASSIVATHPELTS